MELVQSIDGRFWKKKNVNHHITYANNVITHANNVRDDWDDFLISIIVFHVNATIIHWNIIQIILVFNYYLIVMITLCPQIFWVKTNCLT